MQDNRNSTTLPVLMPKVEERKAGDEVSAR
jgi:hypothetical protein